jgi:hypothetical protein
VARAPVKRGAAVVDMAEWLRANGEQDLRQRAQDSGDEFVQVRARRGLVALARVRRKLGDGTGPAEPA